MTESAARAELERELGPNPPGLHRLSPEQCADLLDLVRGTAERDRAAARAELDDSVAGRARPLRAALRMLVFGRRR